MEHMPAISTRTKPLLDNLLAVGDRKNAGQCAPLANQILLSLQSDAIVLRSIENAIGLYVREAGPDSTHNAALAECHERLVSCSIWAAKVGLDFGLDEHVSQALLHLASQNPSSVPPHLHPYLFRLFVIAAWKPQFAQYRSSFLRAAREFDEKGENGPYLDAISLVLTARDALESGDWPAAIGYCRTLLNDDISTELRVLAYELLSDSYRQMGDAERERDSLAEWFHLLTETSQSPCNAAIRARIASDAPSLRGASRSDEILEHYSRFASLHERDTVNYLVAKRIYADFVGWGLGNWVDQATRIMGSMYERLARLEEYGATDGLAQDRTKLVVVEPDRNYGRIDHGDLEESLRSVASLPIGYSAAFLVHRPKINERHFDLLPSLSNKPHRLMLGSCWLRLNERKIV